MYSFKMYTSLNFDVCVNTFNHHPNEETENFQHTKIVSSASALTISQSNHSCHYISISIDETDLL